MGVTEDFSVARNEYPLTRHDEPAAILFGYNRRGDFYTWADIQGILRLTSLLMLHQPSGTPE
jgi:hypothetical protein